MRQVVRLLPAILLVLLLIVAVMKCGCAGTVKIEVVCQPSLVGIVVLRDCSMAPGDAWVSDVGFPVEVWSDSRRGRVRTVLLRFDTGDVLRCLMLPRTPEDEGA